MLLLLITVGIIAAIFMAFGFLCTLDKATKYIPSPELQERIACKRHAERRK
jgi:uncharacterized membrane protein required for colicin V production